MNQANPLRSTAKFFNGIDPDLTLGRITPAAFVAFLVKRFACLYPTYWLALAIFASKGVVNVGGDGHTQAYSLADCVAGVTMASGWDVGAKPFVGTAGPSARRSSAPSPSP